MRNAIELGRRLKDEMGASPWLTAGGSRVAKRRRDSRGDATHLKDDIAKR